jgi:hypothetical protein
LIKNIRLISIVSLIQLERGRLARVLMSLK